MSTIPQRFLEHCRRAPDAPCISFEGRGFSYGEVRARAEAFVAQVAGWGLRPGDRIAICLENSPEFIFAYLGALMARAAVVLVNNQYKQAELRHILSDSGARICVTSAPQRAEIERVRGDLPALERVVDLAEAPDVFETGATLGGEAAEPRDDDVAVIGYTSGTTGKSKGALLLQRNLAANAASICEAWRWIERDRLLLMLPLFHVHGLLAGVNGTLFAAASLELHRRFDAQLALARIKSGAISMFFGVPTMYTRLIAEAADVRVPAAAVRLFVSGSAALSPLIFADFERLFGHRILERYGMTETIMNLTNPYDGERRPGTVGGPFPRQEARIVDVRTRLPLPAEEIGEIEVRGPHVFAGYLNRDDATRESFSPDGWFRTGDLGKRSADGYFSITGRAKELIISGGYNVYPREVEDVLGRCPGVAEVAVFGLPDPEFGEMVCAAIVRGAMVSESDVVDFCRDQLAGYKKPRRVFFVESLPRNAMGKVVKGDLAAQLRGEAAG